MKEISTKDKLPFPEIKMAIDKKELLREFHPIVYWKEEIERLEDELNRKSLSIYAITMIKMSLEQYRKKYKKCLENESNKYLEKYNETINTSEIKAKKGDATALFQLISWNKSWLFKDWVQKRIIIAEHLCDRDFLIKIAKAIVIVKKKRPQRQLINFLKKLKVAGYYFEDLKKIKALRKYLLNYFEDMRFAETEYELEENYKMDKNHPIFEVLLTDDSFNKLLKRNNIRSNRRFRK